MPISFRVRASLVKAPLLSASTNDRSGFRVDRVICLSAHVPARPRHRLRLARVIPSLRKLPALHSWLPRQSHYLWLLPFRFAPTPLLRRSVGPLHFIANPKPPLAFPTCQRRVAPLQTPYRPGAILSATFLPPTEEEAASITGPRHDNFHLSSATLCPPPGPDARCAYAQTPLRLSANHFAHSELPAA